MDRELKYTLYGRTATFKEPEQIDLVQAMIAEREHDHRVLDALLTLIKLTNTDKGAIT